MSNQLFPFTPSDFGQSLFVATSAGAIVDPTKGNPIRPGIVVLNNNASALTMTLNSLSRPKHEDTNRHGDRRFENSVWHFEPKKTLSLLRSEYRNRSRMSL
jgi:hypothetical protein